MDRLVSEKVSARLKELWEMNSAALRILPLYSEEQFDTNGKTQRLGIFRDTKSNGETLMVVQCKNTYFLGFGRMYVEGFVVDKSDQHREANEEDLWKYS